VVYRLVFRPQARADIRSLHDYIAEKASAAVAAAYISRLQGACEQLLTFPERGTARTEVAPGVRIIGFEHRTSIAFRVEGNTVRILRLLHGGQDFPQERD
jgi:toxin ParE1/3/4